MLRGRLMKPQERTITNQVHRNVVDMKYIQAEVKRNGVFLYRENLKTAIIILLNWRFVILSHVYGLTLGGTPTWKKIGISSRPPPMPKSPLEIHRHANQLPRRYLLEEHIHGACFWLKFPVSKDKI